MQRGVVPARSSSHCQQDRSSAQAASSRPPTAFARDRSDSPGSDLPRKGEKPGISLSPRPSFLFTDLVVLLTLFILSGCAGAPRKSDYAVGYRESGQASWYGKDFHGRPTSSGEIYDMHGLSAAHQTLPLGTRLRVTELKSNRSVQVRVNDRGPFVGDRILDLSYGAAKALGMIEAGTAEVEIEVIGFSAARAGDGRFLVQVGSYQSKENALRVREKVGQFYKTVYLETAETNAGRFHRVRIGPFRTEKEAREAARRLPEALASEGLQPVVLRGD